MTDEQFMLEEEALIDDYNQERITNNEFRNAMRQLRMDYFESN